MIANYSGIAFTVTSSCNNIIFSHNRFRTTREADFVKNVSFDYLQVRVYYIKVNKKVRHKKRHTVGSLVK
jgi:hypothetical protein